MADTDRGTYPGMTPDRPVCPTCPSALNGLTPAICHTSVQGLCVVEKGGYQRKNIEGARLGCGAQMNGMIGDRDQGSPMIRNNVEVEVVEAQDPNCVEEADALGDPGVTQGPQELTEDRLPGHEDVHCDSCIESPRVALKSCLVCLVSYCQEHLRPHLEKARFQSHRLVAPMQEVQGHTCENHRRPLELYCRADACCLCMECVDEEHVGHDTTPVTEARKQIEEELKETGAELLKTMMSAEKAIEKLQSSTISIKSSVAEARVVIEQQFSTLQAAVEKAKREVTDALEAEEMGAIKQAEGIRAHLEQKFAELRRTQRKVEKLSSSRSHILFLQEYSQWKKETVNTSLPDVSIDLLEHLTIFSRMVIRSTQQLCDQLLSTYKDKLKAACKKVTPDKRGTKKRMKQQAFMPETRDDFLKYSSPLSFDPDTAHKFLRLMEDNKKVTNTTPWQHGYPEALERFEHWRQVLVAESFYQGQHYFEVDVNGEGTHVGLTYKSINRKSQAADGCITGNDFSWCLCWDTQGFSAWHANVKTPLKAESSAHVGVYLDYNKGLLAFYEVAETMTCIHEFRAEFQEPLYPAFLLSKKENVVTLVSPGNALPLKDPSLSSATPKLSP